MYVYVLRFSNIVYNITTFAPVSGLGITALYFGSSYDRHIVSLPETVFDTAL